MTNDSRKMKPEAVHSSKYFQGFPQAWYCLARNFILTLLVVPSKKEIHAAVSFSILLRKQLLYRKHFFKEHIWPK